MAMRLALTRSRELLAPGARYLRTSVANASAEGSSVAAMVKAVNETSGSNLLASLKEAKAKLQPYYPEPAASATWSLQARLAVLGALSWTLYRLDTQSRAHEWIVDLSLDVLQAAWYVSFLSLIPFRSVFVALRGLAPSTSTPLAGLRTAVAIKP
ncbi:hypothetical protein PLESTB_000103300 [Pleodorina starrii]|uniref:Uncharacterized protein n=1 Tax=Pleodorina starrii TaxID=330485 RepID=A0A9W6BBA8_9CHLO|nr:hypothetical protein PLESTM_000099700 [Pleodorina starrii]GLC48487.1 hypothetical protein PLESTB_000103300 [Pleodorina starrii]GLC71807.1 hypothetical protein PLESTF_001169100 [Pleodorina starrii]